MVSKINNQLVRRISTPERESERETESNEWFHGNQTHTHTHIHSVCVTSCFGLDLDVRLSRHTNVCSVPSRDGEGRGREKKWGGERQGYRNTKIVTQSPKIKKRERGGRADSSTRLVIMEKIIRICSCGIEPLLQKLAEGWTRRRRRK